MYDDEDSDFSIADTVRSVARELGDSIGRMLDQLEFDQPAQSFGIDPDRAKEWAETAGHWLRATVQQAGDELADRLSGEDDEPSQPRREEPPQPKSEPKRSERKAEPARTELDPLRGAAPSPLDVPSSEQGLALAAIDSGRWTVEPGTETLASYGDGPGPSDALGLVRELRVRDWITVDGELTLAGRRALSRWLEASR
jgi:hypothetical protein